jgi:hypothetical protein
MSYFSPVTEAVLSRARADPAFRQKLLQQSLDVLLDRLQREAQIPRSVTAKHAQMREDVTLALRLAELIRTAAPIPERALAFRGGMPITPAFRSTPAGG